MQTQNFDIYSQKNALHPYLTSDFVIRRAQLWWTTTTTLLLIFLRICFVVFLYILIVDNYYVEMK